MLLCYTMAEMFKNLIRISIIPDQVKIGMFILFSVCVCVCVCTYIPKEDELGKILFENNLEDSWSAQCMMINMQISYWKNFNMIEKNSTHLSIIDLF